MRATGSYRFSLVVVIAGAIGMIGGGVSPVVGETQNGKRLTTARTPPPSSDATPQAVMRSEESATVTRRGGEFDRVRAVARASGSVRVIVQLDVPNLNALTAASTTAKGRGGVAQADGQLSGAIGNVRGGELAKLAGTQHSVNRTYASVPFIALTVSEQALNVLQASPGILGINEDRLAAPTLNNTVNITGASAAWAQGSDGSGWYVAILDTGIRASHKFFAGKSIVQACFASGEDGFPGVGDCPNGLSSDTTSPNAARHFPTPPTSDHGTHVSGIAAGNDPTRLPPLYGIARGADIIAIQVFSQFFGLGDVRAYSSDQMAGLDYVFSLRGTYNIASANMSLGGGSYNNQAVCDADNAGVKAAIDNLRGAGIATCIASGNDGFCGSISGPACISSAVAVGATTDSNVEASISNWDPTLLDIYGPGVNILSSVGTSDSSYEGNWSGTSMAAPHVAGAWAILKQADPGADVATILSALQTTGDPVTGRCVGTPTQRRIQIDLALGTRRTKFLQLPDDTGEDTASNLDPTDMSPNSVVADDFVSDGRPITAVRWWGSNLSAGSAAATSAQAQAPDRRESATLETSASIPAYTELELASMMAEKARQAASRPTPASDPLDEPLAGGDTCATATVIPALPYSDSGNTCAFEHDYDEVCPNTNPGGRDVAYVFTPPTNMVVDISLCANSAYDTKLYVYEGSCPGTDVACNDDICSTPSFQQAWVSSLWGVSLTGGLTYYIIVDGYSTLDCGNYTLDITLYVPCDVTCDLGATPENEPNCGMPSDTVNGGCNSTPSVFTPILCGDTFCGTGAYNGTNRDTDWYKLVLGVPATVTWTVTAEFQALVGIVETGGVDTCEGITGFRVYTVLPPCTTGSVIDFLPAGTWYLFVAPDFAALVTCGAEYNAALTCGPPPVCGNGIVEPGEECDPPNGTTCNATCQFVTCGDGVVEGNEQCDPPDGLFCDSTCQLIPNPPIDGWLVSFHEPLTLGGAPSPPLALYFCDATIVTVAATSFGACDAHPVRQYDVDLVDCCLLHSYADSRNGLTPGQPGAFLETECFNYDLDIQAVVGHTFLSADGVCTTEVLTGNTATIDFWGWHTTSVEHGLRPALRSMVSMSGPDWLYGPWANITPTCSAPNMAFQLLTDTTTVGGDCNHNGILDACESLPDCQPNGVLDECDIAAGTSQDCQPNTIPDECDIASGAADCQPNGVPDVCELAGNDANGNGIPDECDPPGNIVWDANELSPDRTTRSLRFRVEGKTDPSLEDAIKVTMVDLQNPQPENAVCCPPQDFSAYEYGASCTDPGGCARWVGEPGTFYEA
ncbi:MAG: S8 family serine peptidase, partial [Planctomycetota bacterium]